MYLGIEIGGTKLQLGVGNGDGSPLVELLSFQVDPAGGAQGIRQVIEQTAPELIQRHGVKRIGVGFGGPVDATGQRTIKSHQIEGWGDYPLAEWCRRRLGLPTIVGNDADVAGLAEALFGAGRGQKVVFYITVGSGVGGALIIDGQIHRGGSGVAGEIGHLRPGLHAERPEQTVESIASGWAIAAAAQARLAEPELRTLDPRKFRRATNAEALRQRLIESEQTEAACAADLLQRCQGQPELLTCKMLAEAAAEGNRMAEDIFRRATQTLGWAIAQMITLLGPQVVVIGGGVPQSGEQVFFAPLRAEVNRYVFPPLLGTFQIVPAALGQEVVVHGALALARTSP
jgi:glucokinase